MNLLFSLWSRKSFSVNMPTDIFYAPTEQSLLIWQKKKRDSERTISRSNSHIVFSLVRRSGKQG